jgi:hypothetical protein
MKTFWRVVLARVRPSDRAFPGGCFNSGSQWLCAAFVPLTVARRRENRPFVGFRLLRRPAPEPNYTPLPSTSKVVVVPLSIGQDRRIAPAVPKIRPERRAEIQRSALQPLKFASEERCVTHPRRPKKASVPTGESESAAEPSIQQAFRHVLPAKIASGRPHPEPPDPARRGRRIRQPSPL